MSNQELIPVRKAIATAVAAAFLATIVLPVATADAGHKKRWKKHHGQHVVYVKKHKKRKKHRKHRRHDHGDALAAGIVGLAVGAIIADQVHRSRRSEVIYVQPQPRYVAPQPVYRAPAPRVITYEDTVRATYEPWSPEWYRWCNAKYRSFNPSKGTFRGYDGYDHFCVVK
ncbi:BA14K family protein [Salaquimonas pukyongi]|uniref:BA14K family protein n=1 Tax=Salaquimonas pukyongi TaxID=2712698 RepID=UPI00096BB7A7|nr:BA14K family protein [Salaquimonas pukyongi]